MFEKRKEVTALDRHEKAARVMSKMIKILQDEGFIIETQVCRHLSYNGVSFDIDTVLR